MRPYSRFKIALIIPFALVIACSDPEPEEKPIILPDVDMAKPNVDMDMGQDMSPVDMTPPKDMQPEGPPREQEPNNTPLTANPLDLTKGVQGVIDEMTPTRLDKDVFSFEGKANTIINFEFISGPAFKSNGKNGVMADVRTSDGNAFWYVLTNNSSGRSIYIPFDATYIVTVQQLEAAFPDLGPAPPHGGSEAYYSLKTTVTDLAPTEPEPALSTLYLGNNTDGLPNVYPFTLTEKTHITSFTKRKVYATQLTASRKVIVDIQTGEIQQTVGRFIIEKDSGGNWIEASEYILPPGDYVQVIDAQFNAIKTEYEFMLRKQDGSRSYPVPLGVDSPYQGAVDPHFGGGTYKDNDVFSFSLDPGEQTVITVTAEPGSEPVGGFWNTVIQNNFIEPLSRAEVGDGQLTASIYNPDGPNAKRQDYLVRLDLNDQPRQPDKDYNYTISRTLVPAPITRLETKHIRIDNLMFMPGLPVWFEINVPKDHLWTLDLIQDNDTRMDYLLIREGKKPFTLTAVTVNHPVYNQPASYLTTSDERVLLGVFPSLWSYDPAVIFSPLFKAVDLSGLNYQEVDATVAHTTKETAFELDVTAPVLVKGNLPNTATTSAADFYKVTLQAGQTISIITEPDPDPALNHAPVELYIYDESDQLIAAQSGVFGDAPNDDVIAYQPIGAVLLGTYASMNFTAPADGAYTIELIGKASTSLVPGPYVLKIAPATLDPLITNP